MPSTQPSVSIPRKGPYCGARGRRIIKRTYQNGNLTETRHYYYNHLWQILEERIEKAKTRLRDTPPERLYLWGLRGLNDLVLRDRDSNGNGTLDERLYAVQDANSNVVALMDTAGHVVERFCYDAYGQPLFLRSGKFEASSAFEWNILYTGYYYDADTGLYDVRRRVYHPTLGRWLQPDPLGYVDSLNLYLYCNGSPLTYVDPMGLGFWDALWGFTKTVVVGTIVIGLVTIVAVYSVPVALVAAGALLTLGAVTAGANRYAAGQTTGQIVGGSLADITGLSGVYGGLTGEDIATGDPLNLREAERHEMLGSGLGALALLLYGRRLSRRVFSETSRIRANLADDPRFWPRVTGRTRKILAYKQWEANVPSAETPDQPSWNRAWRRAHQYVEGEVYKAVPGEPASPSPIEGHFTNIRAGTSLAAQRLSALRYRPLGYLRARAPGGVRPFHMTARQLGQPGGFPEFWVPETAAFGPATFHVYPDLIVQFLLQSLGAASVSQ